MHLPAVLIPIVNNNTLTDPGQLILNSRRYRGPLILDRLLSVVLLRVLLLAALSVSDVTEERNVHPRNTEAKVAPPPDSNSNTGCLERPDQDRYKGSVGLVRPAQRVKDL